ncbi:hypothetical protein PILCRDRAFT_125877 [Piloderma croceum F 1598]|uniref:Uncharacterized protein n=1 Tax=Piloderma croceum (strain F 1598) TaxID=765440 RepID=A0A0C3G4Z0_PILCF|nr:hypothetical protein PILCRDRAFT_125877 [Piloderma croceum F 1598]
MVGARHVRGGSDPGPGIGGGTGMGVLRTRLSRLSEVGEERDVDDLGGGGIDLGGARNRNESEEGGVKFVRVAEGSSGSGSRRSALAPPPSYRTAPSTSGKSRRSYVAA